jgi:hypothetical protein
MKQPFVQIADTQWVNLEHVTDISYDGTHLKFFQVTSADDGTPSYVRTAVEYTKKVAEILSLELPKATDPNLLGAAEAALLCFSNDDEWWTVMAENDCPNNISSDERRRRGGCCEPGREKARPTSSLTLGADAGGDPAKRSHLGPLKVY